MNNKIPCKNDGCKGMILPSTADKTGGICMPCFQAIKKKEQDEYIRKNKKDIYLYEGVENPVEILKIMYTPRKYDPLINYIKYPKSQEEIYGSLTCQDINKLKEYAIFSINNDDIDIVEEILLRLVCHTNSNIDECLELLMKKEHYYPSTIFKNTSQNVRDQLISRVETDAGNRNNILCALSWIGDERVVELYDKWRKDPPKWRKELHVPPESYSIEAGWELTNEGIRKNLFYNECYAFEERELSKIEPVNILQKHDESCPWCNSTLTTLFDIDLADPIFGFLHIGGERLRITTCHLCTCYGVIYSKFDPRGYSKWYELNEKPSYLPDIPKDEDNSLSVIKQLALSKEKRDCYYSSSWILETKASQIGGHPTWIQEAEYPKCPECLKHMKFIGQLDCADFEEYGEGIYYAFICEECSITATHYQQT